MSTGSAPYNRQSLLQTLRRAHAEVKETLARLTLDDFYMRRNGKWSPAETLIHLIKSEEELSRFLRRPRILIRLQYGKNEQPSRQYHQLRTQYQEKLKKGFRAEDGPAVIVPGKLQTPTSVRDAEKLKRKLLRSWKLTSENLVRRVECWHEMHLESYLLPHPALDKLSIREHVMLNIYHNLHHIYHIQQQYPRKKSPRR